MTVAALYIDPLGPYPRLLGPELCWDAERDARNYDGPWPVVAHPPCGPWGRLRHLSRNDDPSLAPLAIAQVRRAGGVLEHPRGSLLWDLFGLPPPVDCRIRGAGYTIEVCQCDFGHVARKRTWLYFVRVPRSAIVLPPPREPTHWISGGRGRAGKKARTTPVPPGIKVASAQQRRRTPEPFARWLIELAAASRRTEAA